MGTKPLPKFVVYLRVSTDEQGKSGLGLDAQEAACARVVTETGGSIVRTFSEVASGDDDHRPQLAAAVKLAKRAGATLLVAKLDRLSRAVAIIASMMRDGTPFRVAELASASTLELHLRAIVAQEERDMIASRTKAALSALKRRGVKLGSARAGHWKGREDRRQLGAKRGTAAAVAARHAANAELYADARPIVERLRGASLRELAGALEAAGILTPKGAATWTPSSVARLRAAIEAPAT